MKTIRPKFSVIVVAYKSRAEIEACLLSVPPVVNAGEVEIIVVDNYPSDGIGLLIRDRFPHVRYIQCMDNIGYGRGNNLGFAESRGDVILYLNPDTICNAKALSRCASAILSDSKLGIVSPRLVLADGSIDLACRRSIPGFWDGLCRAIGLSKRFPSIRWFSGYNLTYLPEDGSYSVGAVNGAFMMLRRDIVELVGGFDEQFFMYGDDLDLCIRVAACGYQIMYLGDVQIVHLKGTSVSKDYEAMSEAIFDANRDVFLKHFNPHNSGWVRLKYKVAFGLWKRLALIRAAIRGHRRVRPL